MLKKFSVCHDYEKVMDARLCKVCGWRHIFLDEGLMQSPEDLTELLKVMTKQ